MLETSGVFELGEQISALFGPPRLFWDLFGHFGTGFGQFRSLLDSLFSIIDTFL